MTEKAKTAGDHRGDQARSIWGAATFLPSG